MTPAEAWKWHPPAGVALFTTTDGAVWVTDSARCVRLDAGALAAVCEPSQDSAERLRLFPASSMQELVERVRRAQHRSRLAAGLDIPRPGVRRKRWPSPRHAEATLALTSLPGARLEYVQADGDADTVDCVRVLVDGVLVGFAMAQRVDR